MFLVGFPLSNEAAMSTQRTYGAERYQLQATTSAALFL